MALFYRNVRAREQLELFLVAAASSVLLVRFYLYITGYPQIGGGGLHIAHMLWGGVLMLVALAIGMAFLGATAQRAMAFIGGVGFGVFIDELGKFITQDNNYFYQPTIGLIYAIFIILYLTFNFLSRKQTLTSREYQLNALAQLEEAVARDMDPEEKRRVGELLAQAEQDDRLTKALRELLAQVRTIPRPPASRLVRAWRTLKRRYHHRWQSRHTSLVVRIFFITEVLVFVAGGFITLFTNIDSILDLTKGDISYSAELAIGQLVSALVAAGFAIWGVFIWPRNRLRAYEQFRRATLVNLFLTQFFAFARLEFAALPGFMFNLALLGFIAYATRQHTTRQGSGHPGQSSEHHPHKY